MFSQATQIFKQFSNISNDNNLNKIHHQIANTASHLEASFIHKRKDIIAAQKLRYRVFTEEYGAKIRSVRGIDKDRFDKHCLHLVVKDTFSNEIIGYSRILTDTASQLTGGFYSASEFDLSAIAPFDGPTIEIGRTCIDARYRNGATIKALWTALGNYLTKNNIRFLIGCGSISMADGGLSAQSIMNKIRSKHMTSSHIRVSPYKSVDLPKHPLSTTVEIPPLLKTYLSMGSKVAGEPFWDTDFNVADLFIILDMKTATRKYKNHFMRENL